MPTNKITVEVNDELNIEIDFKNKEIVLANPDDGNDSYNLDFKEFEDAFKIYTEQKELQK